MKVHRITVTVDDSRIQVSPDTLVMNANEQVKWEGTNAKPFSIEFDGAGPFATSTLAHPQAIAQHQPKVRGRFKYTVVSTQQPGVRLDPVIIVEDPPSETNP